MFTKGQNVKLISDWNGSVTWMVRKAIVASCGKKAMKLVDAYTLKPIGGYKPQEDQWANAKVVDCSMELAIVMAEVQAKASRAQRIEELRSWLARSDNANTESSWLRTQRERLAALEAATISVVTPYEPGHEHGPKGDVVEQYKPGPTPKKYVARYNGAVVGQRRSHRTYTHAIVVETKAGPRAYNWSGSLALAQKASTQVYKGNVLAIVEAEVA